jgi:hypothetical protein
VQHEFAISTAFDGECTVKEEGSETGYDFPDIYDAISYVSRCRRGKRIKMTFYDPTGRVIFTHIV